MAARHVSEYALMENLKSRRHERQIPPPPTPRLHKFHVNWDDTTVIEDLKRDTAIFAV